MPKLIFKPSDHMTIECFRLAEKRTFWTQTVREVQQYIGYVDIKNGTYYPWDGRRHDYTVDELRQILSKMKNNPTHED